MTKLERKHQRNLKENRKRKLVCNVCGVKGYMQYFNPPICESCSKKAYEGRL